MLIPATKLRLRNRRIGMSGSLLRTSISVKAMKEDGGEDEAPDDNRSPPAELRSLNQREDQQRCPCGHGKRAGQIETLVLTRLRIARDKREGRWRAEPPDFSYYAIAILSSAKALLTATARSLRTRAQS
jgi:hypothetical protein